MKAEKDIVNVKKQLEKNKVMILGELVKIMNCSEVTVRRQLKNWNSITSYNKNGRYYTLPEIAEFNEYGLWIYRDIGFSKNGNLIQTITHLINSSSAGLYGEDICRMLQFDSYSILARIVKTSPLQREKIYGRFVYFSAQDSIYSRQLQKRYDLNKQVALEMISDSSAVMALVEFILNPESDCYEISRRLSRRGISVNPEHLHNFFEFHGILKKTQVFQPL